MQLKNSCQWKLYIAGYPNYVKNDFRACHLGSHLTISTEWKNNVLEFFIPCTCPDHFRSWSLNLAHLYLRKSLWLGYSSTFLLLQSGFDTSHGIQPSSSISRGCVWGVEIQPKSKTKPKQKYHHHHHHNNKTHPTRNLLEAMKYRSLGRC